MEDYENEEFYTSIKNGFSQLQKFLDEDVYCWFNFFLPFL